MKNGGKNKSVVFIFLFSVYTYIYIYIYIYTYTYIYIYRTHIYIYIYIYIQCPPLILAPLINMSKGSCENKSALFILLIFPSKNSQNSNLSLK